MNIQNKKRIAILGGGPSGLFMLKRLLESGRTDLSIHIFERKQQLGAGMPYSRKGAGDEHITNVSGNEIPDLVEPVAEWIKGISKDRLRSFNIDPDNFNDYKVLPRLLFGQYLSDQFDLLLQQAKKAELEVKVFRDTEVLDIIDFPHQEMVVLVPESEEQLQYDHVIICTGHSWPKKHEGIIPGYFDSPYPPTKLVLRLNHSIAIRGSSLTAIDAIRTLSRNNGMFSREGDQLIFTKNADSPEFKMLMFSIGAMLPAIRFHLEDPHLQKDAVLSKGEVDQNRAENEGFLSLDYIFEKNFKDMFREKQPEFYQQIKDMEMEEFVAAMMDRRERRDPFELFKAEYEQAERSIEQRESIYWKEMLAVLSFAMNYPAKYFSAEDRQRLQIHLMPLIAIVIAFVPQGSAEELLALHAAGVLDLVDVDEKSEVEAIEKGGIIYHYTNDKGETKTTPFETFVDSIGQPHLSFEDFPFKSLMENETISPAKIRFRDPAAALRELDNGSDKVTSDGKGNYYLDLPGITINDQFQVVDAYGALNERIHIMAVPYIGGYNPDYSGLDFCEAASAAISESLVGELGIKI